MNKLWVLKRDPTVVGYDEYDGFVICAASEDEARTIAAKHAADEGMASWIACPVCVEISTERAGVILSSFNAG